MLTDEQSDNFVRAVNLAIAAGGLTPDDAAALLCGCASEAATAAWGAPRAADEMWLLALQLARRAGLEDVSELRVLTTQH